MEPFRGRRERANGFLIIGESDNFKFRISDLKFIQSLPAAGRLEALTNFWERMMIPQIRKILYATDLSKNSVYAYRHAMDMAEKYDAEIVILHVIEPIPPMVKHYVKGFVDEINWEEKIKYEQGIAIERIKKRLEEFCKKESQDTPH